MAHIKVSIKVSQEFPKHQNKIVLRNIILFKSKWPKLRQDRSELKFAFVLNSLRRKWTGWHGKEGKLVVKNGERMV